MIERRKHNRYVAFDRRASRSDDSLINAFIAAEVAGEAVSEATFPAAGTYDFEVTTDPTPTPDFGGFDGGDTGGGGAGGSW